MDIEKALGRFQNLRGIFALWIVLGHCCMVMDEPGAVLKFIQRADLIFVGFFLFLSGYGLENSLENKADYLKGFLVRKPLKLLLMAVCSLLIADVVMFLLGIKPEGSGSVFTYLSALFSTHMNWYIYEQVFFYILFYCSALFIGNRAGRFVCIAAVTVIMMGLLSGSGLGRSYFYSALSFPFGVVAAMYRKEFEGFIKKHTVAFILFNILFIVISALLMRLGAKGAASIYGRNLVCISASSFMCATLLPFDSELRALVPLRKISLDIYLYHSLAISIVAVMYNKRGSFRGYVFLVLCIAMSIVLAAAAYFILRRTPVNIKKMLTAKN